MPDPRVHCSYEGVSFPASEFSDDGEHLGQKPRHLITGDLVRTGKDGNTPLEVTVVAEPAE